MTQVELTLTGQVSEFEMETKLETRRVENRESDSGHATDTEEEVEESSSWKGEQPPAEVISHLVILVIVCSTYFPFVFCCLLKVICAVLCCAGCVAQHLEVCCAAQPGGVGAAAAALPVPLLLALAPRNLPALRGRHHRRGTQVATPPTGDRTFHIYFIAR